MITKPVEQAGFIYIYLSNESNTTHDVYFDDLRVTHTKSKILQEDHYYPFGATINALSSSAPLSKPNKFKYNGKELNEEFDLDWYSYGAREYDPQLGRFHTQDRFADKYSSMSPYQYAANNPITNVDINGDSVWVTNDVSVSGNVTTINRTVHITGKVLDEAASGTATAKSLAADLNKRLNAQSTSEVRNIPGGSSIVVNTTIDANYQAANSMDDVDASDHLLVMVDNVTGKADPKLGGGEAEGIAQTPGKVGYVEGRSRDIAETAFHEVGHNLGLHHPDSNSASNPMSYTGRGANFSAGQMETIVDGVGASNRGNNFAIMGNVFPGVSTGSFGTSTQSRPFLVAPSSTSKIPLPFKKR